MNLTSSYELLKKSAEEDFLKYSSLPMAVYITAEDGTILQCNDAAKNLLSIDENDVGKIKITNFYSYKKEREFIIERLRKLTNGEWERNETLEFVVENETKSLRFFAKPFFNKDKLLLGSLCIVFEIKEIERFREMEDTFSVGIFEVIDNDEMGFISYSNPAFRRLFSNSDSDLLNGTSIINFFSKKTDLKKIIQTITDKIKIEETIPNAPFKFERVRLKRIDGSAIIADLNIIPEIFENGRIKKIKGVVEDFTAKNILEEVPIGLCIIKEENDGDKIISANEYFAQIHGCKSAKDCEKINILSFYPKSQDYTDFKESLKQLDKAKKIIKDYVVRIKSFDGTEKDIAITAKIIHDNEGKVFGIAAAVYDLTEEVEKAFREKKTDYAKFLHSYEAMLDNIQLTLNGIISVHGTELLENKIKINLEKAILKLNECVRNYTKSLKVYLDELNRNQEIENATIERINYFLGRIWDKREGLPKQQASWLRLNVKLINEQLPQLTEKQKVNREVQKQYLRNMSDVFRFSRIASLDILRTEIKEMGLELLQLKKALVSDNVNEIKENIDVIDVLFRVVGKLSEFSTFRNIEIRVKRFALYNYIIVGNERELSIAFFNVIHNAIKYSWHKRRESDAWINVEIIENKKDQLVISVENWGVAIRQMEIDTKAIWNFSYRGASSSDKEREGSGIGLNQAQINILNLGGEIDITSDQATFKDKEKYKNAFLTKVTITLPVKRK